MQDYFKKREYFIEHLWFYTDECRYDGNGVMTWSPDTGFHIAVRVKRNKTLPTRKDFKVVSLNPVVLIRMKLIGGFFAIAPRINVVNIDDIALISGLMSLDVGHVIFIQPQEKNTSPSSWFGSALYETKTNLVLPDIVSQETRIGERQPLLSYSRAGLNYEDGSGQKVVGQLNDKRYLEVNWSLPNSAWSKINNWQFAEGLRDAISMISGEAIQLRYRQSYRYGRFYKEMQVGEQPFNLGIVFRPFDTEILDKDIIIQLANFLTHTNRESDICHRIFYQMADASRQKTWQARELLLSTILEAALRTLYDHPFAQDKNKRTGSFSLEGVLKKFREKYFSDTIEGGREWKKAIHKVIGVQRRLRDRNAHPDWSSGQGGSYSTEEMEHTINGMIFLSRFYGYMILALAGFKGLEPRFPKPFSDWEPIMTFTRTT